MLTGRLGCTSLPNAVSPMVSVVIVFPTSRLGSWMHTKAIESPSLPFQGPAQGNRTKEP